MREHSWHFFNKDSFTGLREYLGYGIPSMLMLVLEIWAFEAMLVMSGFLGVDEQSANVVLMNTVGLVFMTCLGVSYPAAGVVGNNLGGGMPKRARKFADVALFMGIVISTFYFVMLTVFRNSIAEFYTYHDNVSSIIASTLPFTAAYVAINMLQGTIRGPICAMGFQKYATYVSIVSYWIVAIPFAYVLTFPLNLRIIGIYLGMPIGSCIVFIAYQYKIMSTDWYQLSKT